jgi:hypothetical protein
MEPGDHPLVMCAHALTCTKRVAGQAQDGNDVLAAQNMTDIRRSTRQSVELADARYPPGHVCDARVPGDRDKNFDNTQTTLKRNDRRKHVPTLSVT